MYAKLAIRNVKRQIVDYIIYFITVTLTVAMMFSLSNLIYSKELMYYASNVEEMKDPLLVFTILISMIVAGVLGYAASFLLKQRKREFGTYLTLGMTRRNILTLFTVENLCICMVALVTGILLGIVIFQGVMGMTTRFMDLDISIASYSVNGLKLTIGLVAGMFLVSTIFSMLYLRKVSIHSLIYAERKTNKTPRFPLIWLLVGIVSLVVVAVCYVHILDTFQEMLGAVNPGGKYITEIMQYFCILIVCIMLSHIGIARSIVNLLIKNASFRSRGTKTFVLRQLSGQLKSNSVICGLIAVLIVLAILGINVSIGQKGTTNRFLNRQFPYDINMNLTKCKNAPYTYEEAKDEINQYTQIGLEIPYHVYESDRSDLYDMMNWNGAGHTGIQDTFILESEFNRLITELGYEPVDLDPGFIVILNAAVRATDFTGKQITYAGQTYEYKASEIQYPVFASGYLTAVIPDEAAADLTIGDECVAIKTTGKKMSQAQSKELYDKLEFFYQSESGVKFEYGPLIRSYHEMEENSMTAILLGGAMYSSIILVFMAVAILTLKILSGIAQDRRNYRLLYQLGVSKKQQKKTLKGQLFCLFLFPYLLPILSSMPIAYACGQVIRLSGTGDLVSMFYQNALIIALIISVVYWIYYIATLWVEKRRVLV